MDLLLFPSVGSAIYHVEAYPRYDLAFPAFHPSSDVSIIPCGSRHIH